MRIRKVVLLLMAFLALQIVFPGAMIANEPKYLIGSADGWAENLYEDENISVSFAMANLRTYVRIINKTDKIMRFSWPAASFLLPDGTARTLCFMYEKIVSDGVEFVPLTKAEKAKKNPPPGVIIIGKAESKFKTALLAGNDDLLIPPGCAVFCQLGFNSSRYTATAGGSVKGLIPELTGVSHVAESEFFYVISEFSEGSIFEWTLQYDFAGNEKAILVKLWMQ